MAELKRSEKLRITFNALGSLIADVQKYDRLEIKPQFAKQLNDVMKGTVELINELEAEEKSSAESE